MCFESWSFIKRSDFFDLILLHVFRFLHQLDKILNFIVFEFALINVVEIQNCAVFGILVDLEITKFAEEMSDVFGCQVCGVAVLENHVDDLLVSLSDVQGCFVWFLGVQDTFKRLTWKHFGLFWWPLGSY